MAFLREIFMFCVLLRSFSYASFDIDEINSIYYGLDILGSPIIKDKFSDVLLMVNRLGQEYACTLPIIPSELKSSGNKDDSASQVESVDIAELLKPMEEAPCLLTKKDWWTYEFCYGQVIKQYHMEGGKSTGAVLILGRFESEYDWSAGGKGAADVATGRNSNRLQRFHSQYYTNGTKCDVTGEPRRSEVRFKCETDVGDYIERVDEPESCRYIVTIATTRVCHHPYLRPHPSRTPHQISCSPVLEEHKYKLYQEKQERKKKAAKEKARNAVLTGDRVDEESDINIKLINLGSALNDISSPFLGTVAKASTEAGDASVPSPDSPTNSEVADSTSSDSIVSELVGVGSVIEVPLTENDETDVNEVEGEEDSPQNEGREGAEEITELEDESVEEKEDEEKESEPAEETEGNASPPATQLDNIIQKLGKQYNKMSNSDLIEASLSLNKLREQLSTGTDELQDLLEDTLTDLDDELAALSDMAEKRGDQGKVQLWQALTDKVKKMKEKSKILSSSRKKEKEPEFGTDEWLQWRIKKNEKIIAKAQETLSSVGDMNRIMDAKTVAEAEKMVKEAALAAAQVRSSKTENEKHDDEDKDVFQLFSSKMVDEFIKEYLSDQDAGSKDQDAKLAKNLAKGKRGEEAEESSVVISSLQQSIKNKIKEAGIDVNKHKIEVQILTPGAEFGGVEDKLSAEQAASVETLVVKLMGAQKEEIIEREKHETLSDNYNFSFEELGAGDDDSEPSTESPVLEMNSEDSLGSTESAASSEEVSKSDLGGLSTLDGEESEQSRNTGGDPPSAEVDNEPAELTAGFDEGD